MPCGSVNTEPRNVGSNPERWFATLQTIKKTSHRNRDRRFVGEIIMNLYAEWHVNRGESWKSNQHTNSHGRLTFSLHTSPTNSLLHNHFLVLNDEYIDEFLPSPFLFAYFIYYLIVIFVFLPHGPGFDRYHLEPPMTSFMPGHPDDWARRDEDACNLQFESFPVGRSM
jgi:hypothetical protein